MASTTKKLKTEESGDEVVPAINEENGDNSLILGDEVSNISEKNGDEIEFNLKRVRVLKESKNFQTSKCNGVVYWMSRDVRVQDNWALIYAQKLALKHQSPLHVVYCLPKDFPNPTRRRVHFLLGGLWEVANECRTLNINFQVVLEIRTSDMLPLYLKKNDCRCVVADMSVMNWSRDHVDDLVTSLDDTYTVHQVDAHNVVPVWEASDKHENSYAEFRTKLHAKLDAFLTEFPAVTKHPYVGETEQKPVNWRHVEEWLDIIERVGVARKFTPGTAGGMRVAQQFIETKLKNTTAGKEDAEEGESNMSQWFTSGQISAQKVLLMAKSNIKTNSMQFAENLLVRKEIADNFCWYGANYNVIKEAAKCATVNATIGAQRWMWGLWEFQNGMTHDPFWNKLQTQLVVQGKMHTLLRIYWAKKICEWTENADIALDYINYLNDRFFLDGCDPAGVVGTMSVVCGLYDTAQYVNTVRDVVDCVRDMGYRGDDVDIDTFVEQELCKIAYQIKSNPIF